MVPQLRARIRPHASWWPCQVGRQQQLWVMLMSAAQAKEREEGGAWLRTNHLHPLWLKTWFCPQGVNHNYTAFRLFFFKLYRPSFEWSQIGSYFIKLIWYMVFLPIWFIFCWTKPSTIYISGTQSIRKWCNGAWLHLWLFFIALNDFLEFANFNARLNFSTVRGSWEAAKKK